MYGTGMFGIYLQLYICYVRYTVFRKIETEVKNFTITRYFLLYLLYIYSLESVRHQKTQYSARIAIKIRQYGTCIWKYSTGKAGTNRYGTLTEPMYSVFFMQDATVTAVCFQPFFATADAGARIVASCRYLGTYLCYVWMRYRKSQSMQIGTYGARFFL